MMNFEKMARKTKAELFDILKEKQAEIDRLKKLMNGVLDSSAQTAAIASQMKSESSPEIIESEREMNALLTEENLQLQSEMERLKAQLECCRKENTVLLGKVGEGEKRVGELNQWNSNQYELIKRNESHTQSLKHLLQKLIDDDYTTMRPSMAYEIQEILRGEHE